MGDIGSCELIVGRIGEDPFRLTAFKTGIRHSLPVTLFLMKS
jgi:hypothetical protein